MGMDRRKFLGITGATAAAAGTSAMTPRAASAVAGSPTNPTLPGFTSKTVRANGIKQHYVAGGSGDPLILLHGWPQTWWEFHKIMPALAKDFHVIAVDLRGIGRSEVPEGGYDKKTMARDIYELSQALGLSSVNIAGHDIGSMIAYSFAANHPKATKRIAMLDVLHPDESYYEYRLLPQEGQPHLWWWAFNQVQGLPEDLVEGRGRHLVDWMFDSMLVDDSAIDEFDRDVYGSNYSTRSGIRGSNGWYQGVIQDIEDGKTYDTIEAPVLGLAHSMFLPDMKEKLPQLATNVQVEEVTDAGHYFVEEQPQQVIDHFQSFFG